MSAKELTFRRQAEQREAAEVLGVKKVIFCDHTDGELIPVPGLKAELVRLIRTFVPTFCSPGIPGDLTNSIPTTGRWGK